MKQGITTIFASILALGAAPALAQEAGAPVDSAETRQHAARNMGLLMSALNAEQVSEEVKTTLLTCIYGNSLREITVAMDRAIEADPERFDRSDNGVMLGVMAGVCGLQPGAEAGDAPAEPR